MDPSSVEPSPKQTNARKAKKRPPVKTSLEIGCLLEEEEAVELEDEGSSQELDTEEEITFPANRPKSSPE